ncbi:hypothetical protein [Streptomyces sp. RTd22]|uniref:hypothetical protein n=1 Tax=Streptomyces sp. RTd22 TaxID=1841249 RepID=UPI0007C5C879|nr:hypothetical protein [Streptomyces sp. RTd22]
MNHENDTPGPEDPDRRGDREPLEAAPDGATPDGAGTDNADADGKGSDDAGSDGTGADDAGDVRRAADIDEQALRRMLHYAVDELEPPPHALEHLRRAVPARRARRRQALVGAVAAVVLGGAALPALVHVTSASNASNDRPANAASSHRTPQGGDSSGRGEGSGGKDPDGPSDKARTDDHGDKGKDGKKDADKPSKGAQGGDSGGTAPDPSSTLNATSPTCSRTQLGGNGGSAGTADAEGRVYGSFRVVNTSGQACMVEGDGRFGVAAQGSADPGKVFFVDHTAGDAAGGLPDPATEPGTLILQPGQAYEVRFAWIPASGGGPSGCPSSGDGTPTASPTPDAGGPADQPGSGDPSGSPGGGGGEQPAASVQVSYTPEAGEPAVGSVTLSGACAGTVYGTGLLASS